MKKQLMIGLIVMLSGVCGCAGTDVHTFTSDGGDKISVSARGKYDLVYEKEQETEPSFEIRKDEDYLGKGTFIPSGVFEECLEAIKNDPNAEILEEGEIEEGNYIFWTYAECEYNYAVRFNDSDTVVILENVISEESARDCFKKISVNQK